MDEKTLLENVKRTLEEIKKERDSHCRFDIWYKICHIMNSRIGIQWDSISEYVSHEPTFGFVKFCFCKEKLYCPFKCLHFALIPCKNTTEVYCIPYDTLELRTHEKLRCPDGEYKKAFC